MIIYSGNPKGSVVVVGGAPSFKELETQRAFLGETGDVVEDLLKEVGFPIEEVCYVSCYGQRKECEAFNGQELRDYFDAELRHFINSYDRRVIIPLGNDAICTLKLEKKPQKVNSHRGRINLTDELHNVPIVPSIHPYILLKEPVNDFDVIVDLKYAQRVWKGNLQEQEPIHIIDIESPKQILTLLEETLDTTKRLSYDIETTGLDFKRDIITTKSFFNGKTVDGVKAPYFLGLYDKLVPRFSEGVLQEFKEAFRELYSLAGKGYDLVSANGIQFDDLMVFEYLGEKFAGTTRDTRLEKWCVNSEGSNGLKENTARYLGYPNYDAPVDAYVSDITSRRSKAVISHDEDLQTIKFYGMEPDVKTYKNGKEVLCWPAKLNKKACAWALLPYELVRVYNCYDAVYTDMLDQALLPMIVEGDLQVTCELKHRAAVICRDIHKDGFLHDIKTNEEFSKQCEDLEISCMDLLQKKALEIDQTLLDFNPRSGPQVAQALFGQPVSLPHINPKAVGDDYDPRQVEDILKKFHTTVYDDYKEIITLEKAGQLDRPELEKYIKQEWFSRTGLKSSLMNKLVYTEGIYQPEFFTKTGAPKTGRVVLESLFQSKQDPFLSLELMYRKISKLRSTFLDGICNKLDDEQLLHYILNCIGTKSGRWSSSNPNLQNLIKYIRGLFIPRPGCVFTGFDIKSAEVFTLAAHCQDANLLQAISEKDIHFATASMLFDKPVDKISAEERRFAKTILFGLIFGLGPTRLAITLGITLDEARELIDQFFETYPGVAEFIETQHALAAEPPYFVTSAWGTRRSTKNILSSNPGMVKHVKNIAVNHPIQGGAGQYFEWLFCEIQDELDHLEWHDVKPKNATHDSGTWEHPPTRINEMRELYTYMVAKKAPVYPLNLVTFEADIDKDDTLYNWYGKPDLMKALDPEPEKSIFMWEMLDAENRLDKEDLTELYELEEILEYASRS